MKTKNGAFASTGSLGLEKVELAFREALQDVYGQLDFIPEADGTIHRFHVPGDRPGSQNGWYVLFADGIASGCFGSWKQSSTHTWNSRLPANPIEVQQLRRRVAEARQQRLEEQRLRQQSAANYAQKLWRDARRADPAHPYLIAKQARPHALRQYRDRLLIPLYRDGELVNLQSIQPNGAKLFQAGGQVKGCYSPLGNLGPGKQLFICEGWATGATLHEQTGSAVACAMNAGNLKPVAIALRDKYPDADIVIAGDDDRLTEGNPGRTAAIAAALAVGAQVTFPEWPEEAPLALSDFNDLHCWRLNNGD